MYLVIPLWVNFSKFSGVIPAQRKCGTRIETWSERPRASPLVVVSSGERGRGRGLGRGAKGPQLPVVFYFLAKEVIWRTPWKVFPMKEPTARKGKMQEPGASTGAFRTWRVCPTPPQWETRLARPGQGEMLTTHPFHWIPQLLTPRRPSHKPCEPGAPAFNSKQGK